MAYQATVIPVMIASPSDVPAERQAIVDLLHEWNVIHSLEQHAVLLPVRWETHSAPDMGGRAQELINTRVLAQCDILVGIFWTKLGTPTGDAVSGTVEEIQRHIDGGKLAMIYFSDQPAAPSTINPEQSAKLAEFKSWCQPRGLYEEFTSIEKLREKFSLQLQVNLYQDPYVRGLTSPDAESQAESDKNGKTSLSDAACSFLLTATSGRDGMILRVGALGGVNFSMGGQSFVPADAREEAKWDAALQELVDLGAIVRAGGRGQAFKVAHRGYEIAAHLRVAG